MFIEIRKRGSARKYYAVHSFREGKKLVKIRKYLGQDLTAEEIKAQQAKAVSVINEQLKIYKEIRDPLKYVLSPEELQQLKTLEAREDFSIHHLSKEQWKRFSQVFSYNTNAIEGSTLTLREVAGLAEHKLPDKPSYDISEARGVIKAVEYVRDNKEQLSLVLIRKLHSIVFEDTKSFEGQFRKAGVEVVIRDGSGVIIHRGAPSKYVESLLKELIDWYLKNKKKYPGILLAAVVHNQFENIHPFQDGNGRVGRLLLNLILLRHNLPPVNIEFTKRQEYYRSLQAYQNTGNIRPTIELLLKEYRNMKTN